MFSFLFLFKSNITNNNNIKNDAHEDQDKKKEKDVKRSFLFVAQDFISQQKRKTKNENPKDCYKH